MIRVYNSTERDFRKNGLQVLDRLIIDPVISEAINGLYQFEFSIPISSSDHIEKENIIVAPTPTLDDQAFRISQIRKTNGMYYVTCYHIFYDLTHNIIEDINIVNSGASGALDKINEGCIDRHPFSFHTDIYNKVANCRLVRYNPVRALLGSDDNTFINRWGGEIERNNFNITMKKRLGIDSSVKIMYKKNLIGYEADIDYTQITTKIMPKASDGLLLPEKYIKSPKINNYHTIKTKVIEYSDIKVRDENSSDSEGMSRDEAYTEMRRRAWAEFSENHIDEPRANYKVNFIDLEMTKEFKHLKKLESVNLGDRLKVIHMEENLDISARVISYKYNPVSRRYIEIELGNVADKFTSITSELKRINDKIDTEVMSAVDDSKKAATKILKDGFGGHVKILPDKILIMDTDNINTAKKVWMWNKNGLGFSNTGVNGEFGLAMTLDGSIVADYITSGKLNANVIRAGRIKGKNFDLDLDSGIAKFGTNSITKDSLSSDLMNELKGKDGRDGTDATIYEWLKEWNGTYTEIDGRKVVSPNIFAGNRDGGVFFNESGLYAKKGDATTAWISNDGSGFFGNSENNIAWDSNGNIRLPTITTDAIYPGNSERIVLEHGYEPGSNDAKSIDATGDAIRLKYNATGYLSVSATGITGYRAGVRKFATAGPFDGVSVADGAVMNIEDPSSLMVVHSDRFWVRCGGSAVLIADDEGVYSSTAKLSSDAKLKENLCKIDDDKIIRKNDDVKFNNLTSDDVFDFLKNTSLFNYNFKGQDKPKFSLVAQLVKGPVRNVIVDYNKVNKTYAIDVYNYASIIHAGVQEEIKKREALEVKVNSLESDIEILRKELEALKSILPKK
jgi:phage minor structural protein, N-terminal domain protein|nr:MAG TPA: tail protein [Caudoviricetes sp.]